MGTKIFSLFMVRLKPDGFSKQLVRLADFENNIFVPSRKDEEGIDRDVVYYPPSIDFPDKYIGIFSWEPFYSDGWKQENIKPINKSWIEVVDKSKSSCQQIADEIKSGVEWCDGSHDLLLLCENTLALYWPKDQMRSADGKYTYTPETRALFTYHIDNDNVKSCSTNFGLDERKYYATLDLRNIKEPIWIYSPERIISTIIGTRLKAFASLSKRDRQNIRKALSNIDNASIVHEISHEFNCTLEDATKYYEKYIERVEIMLSIEEWDGGLFQTLIENNANLAKKMTYAVEKHWEQENSTFIAQLNDLQSEVQLRKDEVAVIEARIVQAKQELVNLERLDFDIKTRINDQLHTARADLSVLLTEYSWLMQPSKPAVSVQYSDFLVDTARENAEPFEETESLELAQYNLKANLAEAGVLEDARATELAQFLISAYCAKANLLLAGAGGMDIANSLSAALCCRAPTILYLSSNASQQEVRSAMSSHGSDIIVIPNALSASFLDCAISIFELFPQKMFIFLTPFVESLTVEPKGLYEYMLPLFLEYYVVGSPNRDYVYESAKHVVSDLTLQEREIVRARAETLSFTSVLGFTPRQQTIIASIRAGIEKSFRGANLNQLCMLSIFLPYAVATGQTEALSDMIDRISLDSDAAMIVDGYMGRRT